MRRVSKFLVIALLGLGLIAGGTAWAAAKEILSVAKVDQAPKSLDDAAWGKAKALEVAFEGKEKFAGKKASVSTKAVHDGDSIYFLFKWKDPSKSIIKGAWKYDGKAWKHLKGNEDRISLLFEIERIDKFATKGCAIVCHVPAGKTAADGKFGTTSAAQKGDLWHWKAARSDPYHHADDTWVTKISEKKGGRKSDAGSGGDKKNLTKDKKMPAMMLAPGKKLTPDGVLLAENAVEIKDYTTFMNGHVITYRMPKKPGGSRGDIKAVSNHDGSGWTVMLSRKLDTGHEDDTAFNLRKKYSFAMALFDDSGDEDSYDSEVMTLKFDR
jgi:hypothetical protein